MEYLDEATFTGSTKGPSLEKKVGDSRRKGGLFEGR